MHLNRYKKYGATGSVDSTAATRHGLRNTAEYRSWSAMMRRCYNRNSSNYSFYGGIGVFVTKRWHAFLNFYKDMGLKPADVFTLDRINSELPYSKSNCRWANKSVQAINRKLPNTNTSGYRGVSPYKGVWIASIHANGKQHYLGRYADKKTAAIVYNKNAIILHGEHAVLNTFK